ncbi:MAG TPA: choice-of-anchor P family protein, partial [Rugosimonospora sp.]|nr:choice-of-anchor P family protein [Rugosimonospora sp.]
MKAVRIAVITAIGGAVLAVPAPARAAGLGGYTLTASAAPVAVQVFEPTIPIPASPQLELNLSYSRARLESGPVGQALSSLAWPGDGVGYGLPTLLKNPDATYPVKVEASAPGGPADARQEPVPGTGMSTHADGSSVRASAYLAKPSTPALPTLPPPGVTVPTALVSTESVSSQSQASVASDKVTATAYATAGSVSLLGGLVKVDGLRTDTEADSDGTRGTGTGSVTWQSLTVAGQPIAVNQDGVASPLGVTALPALPAVASNALADLGLSLSAPTVTKTGGAVTGRGLTLTVDTSVLRNKLGLGALLDPVLALLPADLSTQLTPWLNVAPKLVFILGTATSQASATTAATGGAAPPPATGPGGGS